MSQLVSAVARPGASLGEQCLLKIVAHSSRDRGFRLGVGLCAGRAYLFPAHFGQTIGGETLSASRQHSLPGRDRRPG